MKRTLGLLAATALAWPAFLLQAEAAPVITVDPATQDVAVGGTATVYIDVSGLTQGVGGFSFELSFDPTLLSGMTLVNDPGVTMGASPLDLSNGIGYDNSGNPLPGNVDVFFVADQSATEGSLSSAQGSSFTLTKLTFEGLTDGLSPLTLSDYVLSESDGSTSIDGVTAVNGQICVGSSVNGSCNGGGSPPPPPSAPEIDPSGALGALTLLAGGLAAIRGRRFKKVDAK